MCFHLVANSTNKGEERVRDGVGAIRKKLPITVATKDYACICLEEMSRLGVFSLLLSYTIVYVFLKH